MQDLNNPDALSNASLRKDNIQVRKMLLHTSFWAAEETDGSGLKEGSLGKARACLHAPPTWGLPHGWQEHPLQGTGGQVSLSRPEGRPSSPLMPHCDIYESVTGQVFRKTNAGVEICVREVHWGAAAPVRK